MQQHNDMWNGVFSHIRHTMQSRQATHAVLYVLTRDKQPHLLSLQTYGAEALATDLSRADNVKYIAFILLTDQDGRRTSEFHPIYPSIEWPHEIVQHIVQQAHQLAG